MNAKQWLLASVAVFVAIAVLEFLIHGVLLADAYQQTASIWRPEAEMQRRLWLFFVGDLIFAPVFALIYAKGYERGKAALAQGLRFGAYMGLLVGVSLIFGWYVVLPIKTALAVSWMVAGFVEMVVAGIVVALVYKP
jgi:hypothetical protein